MIEVAQELRNKQFINVFMHGAAYPHIIWAALARPQPIIRLSALFPAHEL